MNTKCIIIYESIYNDNTFKLAKAMANKLGCRYVTTKTAQDLDLEQYEMLGFGSGIYFGSHHPELFNLVKKMNELPQDVFVFSSRGNPFLGKYHQPLNEVLHRKNKRLIGEFSVCGYDETGPWVIIGGGHKGKPDEKDLKKAVRFVEKTMPQYCMPDYYLQVKNKRPVSEGKPNFYHVGKNGHQVFLQGDRVTINQNVCSGCGNCVRVCPMNVIEIQKNKAIPVGELDCTLCNLCVSNCNQRAITLHYTWRDAINVARRHAGRTALY